LSDDFCYVFDVDGVIIDVGKRVEFAKITSNKEGIHWKKVFHRQDLLSLDRRREIGIKLLKERLSKGKIVFITGRPPGLKKATTDEIRKFTGIKKPVLFVVPEKPKDTPLYRKKAMLLTKILELCSDIVEYHDDDKKVLTDVASLLPNTTLFLHEGNTVKIFRANK